MTFPAVHGKTLLLNMMDFWKTCLKE